MTALLLLVEPTGLRDPDHEAVLDAREQVQQWNLPRAVQLAGELAIPWMLEQDERGRTGHKDERAPEIGCAHLGRQLGKRRERDERGQRRYRSIAEEPAVKRSGERCGIGKDAPRARNLGPLQQAVERLLVHPIEERRRRAIVARAEQRPPIVALVVLRARQRERANHDQRIVTEQPISRGISQLERPCRIVVDQRMRQPVRFTAQQSLQPVRDRIGNMIEPRLD